MSTPATEAAFLPVGRRRARTADGEAALVAGARAGSRDAVEALFRLHWPRLHRAAYLICHDAAAAEDVAQEAFLAALGALDRFDTRRPLAPWLDRIAANRAIDVVRARARRGEVLGDEPPDAAAAARPDAALLAALGALPADQRAVIVLRHLLGYPPREIGRMLGIPAGTVNSRVRRGLDRLAERLEAEEC